MAKKRTNKKETKKVTKKNEDYKKVILDYLHRDDVKQIDKEVIEEDSNWEIPSVLKDFVQVVGKENNKEQGKDFACSVSVPTDEHCCAPTIDMMETYTHYAGENTLIDERDEIIKDLEDAIKTLQVEKKRDKVTISDLKKEKKEFKETIIMLERDVELEQLKVEQLENKIVDTEIARRNELENISEYNLVKRLFGFKKRVSDLKFKLNKK